MPHRLTLWLPLVCFYNLIASGQIDSPYITKIKSYVKRIDSIAARHDRTGNTLTDKIATGIAEGNITQQVTKVTYNKTQRRNDTIVTTKNIGGFSIETMYKGDTVLQILYHDNSDGNIYETFYFNDNLLICAKVRLVEDATGKVIYSGEEFFRDAKIIYVQSPPTEADSRYRDRIVFSWWNAGMEYLKEFKKDRP